MTQGTNPGTSAARHLLLLTMVAFLVNLPFFSPHLVFIHDTLDNFIFLHYTYSEVYCQGEFPRWVPFMGFGMPYDFHIFGSLLPTHYVAMACGWLFGIKDALLLFKLSMFLSQVLFVLGLYVLSRRLFTSMAPVWAVCLGALLTNCWLHNCLLNFTIFYLLPFVLYLVLAFFHTAKPGYLWAACVVETLSLLGTLPYVAPLPPADPVHFRAHLWHSGTVAGFVVCALANLCASAVFRVCRSFGVVGLFGIRHGDGHRRSGAERADRKRAV